MCNSVSKVITGRRKAAKKKGRDMNHQVRWEHKISTETGVEALQAELAQRGFVATVEWFGMTRACQIRMHLKRRPEFEMLLPVAEDTVSCLEGTAALASYLIQELKWTEGQYPSRAVGLYAGCRVGSAFEAIDNGTHSK